MSRTGLAPAAGAESGGLSGQEATDPTELRRRLLRGVAATDRRLRLHRALRSLTWLLPATCLWLLATRLLYLGASGPGDPLLWPSWAGAAVLLLVAIREVAALGRDLPAAARLIDRAGDLRDAVATGLEMQAQLDHTRPAGPGDASTTTKPAERGKWPLAWVTLVLQRAAAAIDSATPRRTVPRLRPRGALVSVVVSLLLLLPVALPRSFVAEALAATLNGSSDADLPPGFEAAALLEDESDRIPGVPELDVRLSDLPFVTLRVREPGADDGARGPGDLADALDGSAGDGADAEALQDAWAGEGGSGDALADEADRETGAELMRELDNRAGAGEQENGEAAGTEAAGEAAEAGAEPGDGNGNGGQPMEDGEGTGEAGGAAAAISDDAGMSDGEADGAAAGIGTAPQEEMVDPFGDLLTPALSLEQALEAAMIESAEEVERRPLATTSATQYRAAEVAMRGATRASAPPARRSVSGADLPAARSPIAWRHREAVRRYLEALAADDETDEGDNE